MKRATFIYNQKEYCVGWYGPFDSYDFMTTLQDVVHDRISFVKDNVFVVVNDHVPSNVKLSVKGKWMDSAWNGKQQTCFVCKGSLNGPERQKYLECGHVIHSLCYSLSLKNDMTKCLVCDRLMVVITDNEKPNVSTPTPSSLSASLKKAVFQLEEAMEEDIEMKVSCTDPPTSPVESCLSEESPDWIDSEMSNSSSEQGNNMRATGSHAKSDCSEDTTEFDVQSESSSYEFVKEETSSVSQ